MIFLRKERKMLLKKSTVHRKYKNNLFIYLFTRKKEYALSPYNEELFAQCEILREYARFVEKVRRNGEIMDMKEAMVSAIRECMEEGILVEFLKEHGEEMSEMSWRIYDTEKILQIQHEEALEEAREEGRAEAERNAEKIIHAQQQEIEKLKKQLALQV